MAATLDAPALGRQDAGVAIYEVTATAMSAVPVTTFAAEHLRERDDVQRLLRDQLGVLDPDLILVAEEYQWFDNSSRRIDLLALDRSGHLVVIELKRTEDGGHMELQALRYAAMVSTMTTEHVVAAYAATHKVPIADAQDQLTSFVETDTFELSNHVRIVLVSANFSQEITATVMWLTQQYGLDIECYRLIPYRLESRVLLDVQRIIPLPEARSFQIQQRIKVAEAAATSAAGGRDFTKYDLHIGESMHVGLSKQGAVHLLVLALLEAGVTPEAVRGASLPQRWVVVHPEPGETVEDAFRREQPARGDRYWFDLPQSEPEVYWVMPRLGGTRTEEHLEALAAVASPDVSVVWKRATTSLEDV